MKRVLLTTLFSALVLSQSALACEIPSSKIRFLAPKDRGIDPKAFLGEHCVDRHCIEVRFDPEAGYVVEGSHGVIGRILAKSTVKGQPYDYHSSSLELDPPIQQTFLELTPILALAEKVTGTKTDRLTVEVKPIIEKWHYNVLKTDSALNFDKA